ECRDRTDRLTVDTHAVVRHARHGTGTRRILIAPFGPGTALADAFLISGADHSPWATPLHITSCAALVALLALIVVESALERRGRRLPWRESAAAEDPADLLEPGLHVAFLAVVRGLVIALAAQLVGKVLLRDHADLGVVRV